MAGSIQTMCVSTGAHQLSFYHRKSKHPSGRPMVNDVKNDIYHSSINHAQWIVSRIKKRRNSWKILLFQHANMLTGFWGTDQTRLCLILFLPNFCHLWKGCYCFCVLFTFVLLFQCIWHIGVNCWKLRLGRADVNFAGLQMLGNKWVLLYYHYALCIWQNAFWICCLFFLMIATLWSRVKKRGLYWKKNIVLYYHKTSTSLTPLLVVKLQCHVLTKKNISLIHFPPNCSLWVWQHVGEQFIICWELFCSFDLWFFTTSTLAVT